MSVLCLMITWIFYFWFHYAICLSYLYCVSRIGDKWKNECIDEKPKNTWIDNVVYFLVAAFYDINSSEDVTTWHTYRQIHTISGWIQRAPSIAKTPSAIQPHRSPFASQTTVKKLIYHFWSGCSPIFLHNGRNSISRYFLFWWYDISGDVGYYQIIRDSM